MFGAHFDILPETLFIIFQIVYRMCDQKGSIKIILKVWDWLSRLAKIWMLSTENTASSLLRNYIFLPLIRFIPEKIILK